MLLIRLRILIDPDPVQTLFFYTVIGSTITPPLPTLFTTYASGISLVKFNLRNYSKVSGSWGRIRSYFSPQCLTITRVISANHICIREDGNIKQGWADMKGGGVGCSVLNPFLFFYLTLIFFNQICSPNFRASSSKLFRLDFFYHNHDAKNCICMIYKATDLKILHWCNKLASFMYNYKCIFCIFEINNIYIYIKKKKLFSELMSVNVKI